MSDPTEIHVPTDPTDPTDSTGQTAALHAMLHLADSAWDVTNHRRTTSGVAETLTRSGPPPVSTLIATVAAAAFPPSAKLALLARLKGAQFPESELVPLATVLVRPDLPDADRIQAATDLINVIDANKADPLGRDPQTHFMQTAGAGRPDPALPVGARPQQPILTQLVAQISSNILTLEPGCAAARMSDKGQPYLSIRNTMRTTKTINQFVDLIDPLNWPQCALQRTFFKSMKPVGSLTLNPKLVQPNHGWSGVITETVDFGPGFGVMQTDLNMTFFAKPNLLGSTYSLNKSRDGKIGYDEGFLMVEDQGHQRVITTQKSVWFTDPKTNLRPDQVCQVWSFASAMLVNACAHL